MRNYALAFGFLLFGSIFGGSYVSAQREDDGMHRIEADTIPNGVPDNHALLVCGADEKRNLIDIQNGYENLVDLGFPPENIYVLTVKGKDVCVPLSDGNSGFLSVDGRCTRENVIKAFHSLSKNVESHDQVFIYLDDHGYKGPYVVTSDGTTKELSWSKGVPVGQTESIKDFSYMWLGDERLNVAEVERLVFGGATGKGINPEKGFILSDFCYSYDFARMLGKGAYTSISSSWDGSTCSVPYDSYSYHFTDAINPKKNGGKRNNVEDAFMQSWGEFGGCSDRRIKTDSPFIESDMDLKGLYVGTSQ